MKKRKYEKKSNYWKNAETTAPKPAEHIHSYKPYGVVTMQGMGSLLMEQCSACGDIRGRKVSAIFG